MILNRCNFFSKTLKNHVDVNVLIPNMPDNSCLFNSLEEIYDDKKEVSVLYLLHGALDDYSMWLRHTNIERYAEEANIAVVMPSGQNGFYSNAIHGLDYFDYVTNELIQFVEYTFPVSKKRENRFIAGPSMGGYGASKCALSLPYKYFAFGNFSGAVDPETLEPLMVVDGYDFFRYDLIFGSSKAVTSSKDDLKVISKNNEDDKPFAFVACGIEDTNNYNMNKSLFDHLVEHGFKGKFVGGNGYHDWEYWDKCVKQFIDIIK